MNHLTLSEKSILVALISKQIYEVNKSPTNTELQKTLKQTEIELLTNISNKLKSQINENIKEE